MPVVHFEKKVALDSEADNFLIAACDFDEDSKKLVGFSVLLVSHCRGKICQIIRYDTAHGYCHAHRFYLSIKHSTKMPFKEISPQAFFECRKDIRENWQKYKKAYFRKLACKSANGH